MRQMKLSTQSHIKYVSFSNSTKQERLRALQLNKFINIRLKYESLNNIGVLNEAVYHKKNQIVVEVIMAAKINGILLFVGIEQGSGRNQNNTYVYFKLSMTAEAKVWIRKSYGIIFKIKGKNEYKTSLSQITVEEETYCNELNDYIIDRLKVITIDETPKMKQKSYMEALKGKEENNKQEIEN